MMYFKGINRGEGTSHFPGVTADVIVAMQLWVLFQDQYFRLCLTCLREGGGESQDVFQSHYSSDVYRNPIQSNPNDLFKINKVIVKVT